MLPIKETKHMKCWYWIKHSLLFFGRRYINLCNDAICRKAWGKCWSHGTWQKGSFAPLYCPWPTQPHLAPPPTAWSHSARPTPQCLRFHSKRSTRCVFLFTGKYRQIVPARLGFILSWLWDHLWFPVPVGANDDQTWWDGYGGWDGHVGVWSAAEPDLTVGQPTSYSKAPLLQFSWPRDQQRKNPSDQRREVCAYGDGAVITMVHVRRF